MTREETLALLVEFFKWAVREGPWDGCDLDGGSVQDKAESLGLLVKTQYDPEKHGMQSEFEAGDDYFVFAPTLVSREASLRSQAESSEYDDSVSAEDVRGILPHSPPMNIECSIGVNNPGICSAGNCRRCDDWQAGWDAAMATLGKSNDD